MKIQAKTNSKTLEVLLYENVGGWFGITASEFNRQLSKAIKDSQPSEIDLRINSDGGDVFDGVAIYNYLKQVSPTVNVHIDGIAASIASIIAMAGDTINMAENAWMMIHNPWGVAIGEAADLRKRADLMDGIRDTLIDTYRKKTHKTADEIGDMLDAETWMQAKDALAGGFVDNITDEMQVAASIHREWFRHAPKDLLNSADRQPTKSESDIAKRRAVVLRRHGIKKTST